MENMTETLDMQAERHPAHSSAPLLNRNINSWMKYFRIN